MFMFIGITIYKIHKLFLHIFNPSLKNSSNLNLKPKIKVYPTHKNNYKIDVQERHKLLTLKMEKTRA